MNRTPTQNLYDVLTGLPKFKGIPCNFRMLLHEVKDALRGTDDVRKGQKEIAQGMAADPFTQYHDTAQSLYSGRHFQSKGILDCTQAGHLMG